MTKSNIIIPSKGLECISTLFSGSITFLINGFDLKGPYVIKELQSHNGERSFMVLKVKKELKHHAYLMILTDLKFYIFNS
jgi:hypothetical protein